MEFNEIFEEINETRYVTITNFVPPNRKTISYITGFSKAKPTKVVYYRENTTFHKISKYYKIKDHRFRIFAMNSSCGKEALIKTFGENLVKDFYIYDPDAKDDCTTSKLYLGDGYHGLNRIVFVQCNNNTLRKDFTKNELKYIDDAKNRQAESRVINSLLKPAVLDICKKYGLVERNGVFYFNSHRDINTFLYEAIKSTLGKELIKNGYRLDMFNQKLLNKGNITQNSRLFSLEDIRIISTGETEDE